MKKKTKIKHKQLMLVGLVFLSAVALLFSVTLVQQGVNLFSQAYNFSANRSVDSLSGGDKKQACLFKEAIRVSNVEYPPNKNLLHLDRSFGHLNARGFTVEFLMKQESRKNYVNPSLFHMGNRLNIFVESGSNGQENKIAVSMGDGSKSTFLVGPEISVGEWHHVAVTYTSDKRSGMGVLGLHVDGQTLTKSGVNFDDNLTHITMGETYFNGYFDEIMISSNVRYSPRKESYKVSTFPHRVSKFTQLLFHLDGDLTDAGGSDYVAQTQGDVEFVTSDYYCIIPTPGATESRVFLTSTTYDGNLGGLAGADAKCQERANAAGLDGSWKAWLSDSKTSAASRLYHSNGVYVLLNGDIVAHDWDDLTDGDIVNPININEFGSSPNYQSGVWTSTNVDGTINPPVANITLCSNYTAADDNYSMCGHNGSVSNEWTLWSSDRCDQVHPIYCFEQVN